MQIDFRRLETIITESKIYFFLKKEEYRIIELIRKRKQSSKIGIKIWKWLVFDQQVEVNARLYYVPCEGAENVSDALTTQTPSVFKQNTLKLI